MQRQFMLRPIISVTWVILCTVGCVPSALPPVVETMAATAKLASTPSAAGIGDPYYPFLGNSGYDVQHYTIVLDVEPVTNVISGTTTIQAHTTQSLSALNLDFVGLQIDHVLVNGDAAAYTQDERELTVTLDRPLPHRSEFVVRIAYHGSPVPIPSVAVPLQIGWFHASNGAIHVVSEPDGAASWFPSNNHPLDKATYRFEITVPAAFVVAASGRLLETVYRGEKASYIWEMDKPMASYLAAINIGDYVEESTPGAGAVLIRNYFPPDFPETSKRRYARLPEMIEFLTSLFGPYPFTEYGVIIAELGSGVCDNILAVEIQTLSIHCPELAAEAEEVIVHELAHQWFGNSVSVKNWQDVWLKEGLATYAQWLWRTRKSEFAGIARVAQSYHSELSLTSSVGQPPASDLYNYDAVYTGGALVFHALRLQVSDEAFFDILRTYHQRFRYGNASTQDFVAVASEVSGQELEEFFNAWLYADELPPLPATR
jgi:aminopeptidase N